MSAELFKIMPRTDLQNVTYRGLGSGGYADLMAGRVHVVFDNLPRSIELARSVKLRPLAVTTATRSEALPDVPVLADFVPGFDVSVWYGLGAPKNTPAEIVDTLNKEINAAFVDPRMKARFADLGGTCFPVRQPNLASSSLTKPRNGARWSERPTSRCYEAAAGSRIHRCTDHKLIEPRDDKTQDHHQTVNDLSRCLDPLDMDTTLIAVIEMSQSSWLVGGIVPGVERQPLKKLEVDECALLKLLNRWRAEAEKNGRRITRMAVAFEAGYDGFWLARWLTAQGVETHAIHAASVAVTREPPGEDRSA